MKSSVNQKGIFLAPVLLVLFIFFIPISPTLKSVFLGGTVVALLITPYYNKYLPYAFNTLWGRTSLLLFLFIVLACYWSPAPYKMQLALLEKYSKLIYLPILVVGFISPKTRYWCINSYFLAMILTFIVSILKMKHIITIGDPTDFSDLYCNHIVTGFMMAWAAYLAGLFVFKYTGWTRALYVLVFLLVSYFVLCINVGRTGFIIYFILMALLLIQKISFKKALLSMALACAVLIITYDYSGLMQARVGEFFSGFNLSHDRDHPTSLSLRVKFHNYAQSLFKKHPLIGVGTGGFKYSYSQDKAVFEWGDNLTDPHSQYWMILAEQGIIGLSLFLLFLGGLLIISLQLVETKAILWGIVLSFCIGCSSDTILCYSAIGYLLIIMIALCFGELIERDRKGRLLSLGGLK